MSLSSYLLPSRLVAIGGIISAALLISSVLLGYLLDLPPCSLCLYQRGFYGAIILIGLSVFILPHQWHIKLFWLMIFLLGLEFLTAFYHTLVEHQWIKELGFCTSSNKLKIETIEDLKTQLLQTPPVRCDVVAWRLFGLSMTEYNLGLSISLIIGFLKAYQKCHIRQPEKH